jgi:hypothetical protein
MARAANGLKFLRMD